MMKMNSTRMVCSAAAMAGLFAAPLSSVRAVSGDWITDGGGAWSTPANWSTNPVVPGTDPEDVINFTNNITANAIVTIDATPRTVGILNIGDASNSFTLRRSAGGSALTMDNNGDQAQINIVNGGAVTLGSTAAASNLTMFVTEGGLLFDKQSASGALTVNSDISTVAPGLEKITVNAAAGASPGNISFNGVISGNLGIDWNTAAGTGIIGGDNSFSGGFNLLRGGVRASNANSFGTGTITLGGVGNATLDSSTNAGDVTIANNIIVSSADMVSTLQFMVRAPNSTYTYSGSVALQRDLILNTFVSSTLAFTGTMSGAGKLSLSHLSSGAAFILAADGSYTGGVSVDQSNITVKLGHATALGTGTFSINKTGFKLDSTVSNLTLSTNNAIVAGNDFTYLGTDGNSLNLGTGAVTITANRTVTVTAGTLVIGGAIGDGGGHRQLIKSGAGVLVLNGANTYTNETSVAEGALRGNGSVAGPLYVSAGASFGAGDGVGTFTVAGDTGFLADSTFQFELNSSLSTHDQLVANGVSLEDDAQISFSDLGLGIWAGGDIIAINNTSGDAISGIFAGYAEGAGVSIGANSFTVTYLGGDGNDFALLSVPEPGAWLLVTAGIGFTLLRRRRG